VSFFELGDATDMLRKVQRELARIEADFSIDHIYNFFVTAYHVTDYLEKAHSVPTKALQELRADYLFARCGDVCNKAKHFKLERRRPDISPMTLSGALGSAPFNMLPLNGGAERWILWSQDDTLMEVVQFARATVAKLENFFKEHGVPL
jgi:hypothetical protein